MSLQVCALCICVHTVEQSCVGQLCNMTCEKWKEFPLSLLLHLLPGYNATCAHYHPHDHIFKLCLYVCVCVHYAHLAFCTVDGHVFKHNILPLLRCWKRLNHKKPTLKKLDYCHFISKPKFLRQTHQTELKK